MRILRAESHRRMPWKNGGGVTTEIAVFPDGACLDDFGWRISMANVASDGPFSLFPGVDRTLAVLEGEGMVLSVEGQGERNLTRATQPFSFAADKPTSARLIAGPIVDLNVMTRRGTFAHRLERISSGQLHAGVEGTVTLVFCVAGSAVVTEGKGKATLAPHDAVICTSSCEIARGEAGETYFVTLTAG
jgi:environmental stress-induced protein Ves